MASRSPTAVTPLPKLSSAPETPAVKETPQTTSPPQPVPFPPPQTFDIIPPLHGLLLRLLSPDPNAVGGANAARTADPGAPVPSQSQQQPSQSQQSFNENTGGIVPTPGGPGSASAAAEIAALSSNASGPLDLKNLPMQAAAVKIRLQKAQAVVDGLPDIHRSVTEQEGEIADLEDRIHRLQSVISDFGKRASTEASGKEGH